MPSTQEMADNKMVDLLVQTIWNRYEAIPSSKRVLVSISGIPGAGKSTLARQLAEKLNRVYLERGHLSSQSQSTHADLQNPAPHTFAVDIPMDGFHLSRAQLRAMPDPETAIHRRGAAFTYDALGYCQLVEQLSQPINDEQGEVYAPAFDHATKDPVADSIRIGRDTRIVILEGNYVNLDREPWSAASMLFDLKLKAAVDRQIAKQRLVKRHVSSGICPDEATARHRVESTDDLNAEDILENQVEGVISVSLPDRPGSV
jgi:pantothenate kinase